jgi:hypothetical protein
MLQGARETVAAFENGTEVEDRALVEARVVQWTLEDLGIDREARR